ncbi:hypothetical protein [Nocardia australiensis]|uniref:hypothetical protein n=1 Tax=Nocardia australiensis TaxID=2887191 RepID=UPI001D153E71|nr:hypothetical protein [Nocardia australiensis]
MNPHDIEHIRYDSRRGRHDGVRRKLSRSLVIIATTSLTAGVVSGGVRYLNRSPHHEPHYEGTAAWWPHVVLFALTVAAIVVLRRRGIHPGSLLLAPLGTTAARRLAHTLRSACRHPSAVARLLIGILPMAMLVYGPYRSGMQILGGLDPNFTVNAWGGPTYLGAMACHYLDGALLMAVAAGLLNLLLLPADKGHRETGAGQ